MLLKQSTGLREHEQKITVDLNSLNTDQQNFTKYYEEFENSGAKTGYRDQFNNSEDRQKALQKN